MLARAPPLVEKFRVALRERGEMEVVIFWRWELCTDVGMWVCMY